LSDAEEIDNPADAVAPKPSRWAETVISDRAESYGSSKDGLEVDHPHHCVRGRVAFSETSPMRSLTNATRRDLELLLDRI
jgi:hypothetical protein